MALHEVWAGQGRGEGARAEELTPQSPNSIFAVQITSKAHIQQPALHVSSHLLGAAGLAMQGDKGHSRD